MRNVFCLQLRETWQDCRVYALYIADVSRGVENLRTVGSSQLDVVVPSRVCEKFGLVRSAGFGYYGSAYSICWKNGRKRVRNIETRLHGGGSLPPLAHYVYACKRGTDRPMDRGELEDFCRRMYGLCGRIVPVCFAPPADDVREYYTEKFEARRPPRFDGGLSFG